MAIIVLPKPGRNIIIHQNFKYREKVPFIIYADFKSLLVLSEHLKKQRTILKFSNKIKCLTSGLVQVELQ